MLKVEALADAIAYVNEYHQPESDAYKLRNPGLLKARTSNDDLSQLASADDKCRRIFARSHSGYLALVTDLQKHCERRKQVNLREFLGYYGLSKAAKTFEAIDFLQRALLDTTIDADTTLSYFLE